MGLGQRRRDPGAFDVGSLTDRTFTYNGIDYGLDVIHTASDGSPLSLNFYVHHDLSCSAAVVPPATAKQDLSLVVNNGQWFPFSDATRHCGGLWRWTWHESPAVEWEAGDRVRLSLVAERAALQSLAVTSTPAAGGVYREGETIDVDARFTLGVNVDVAQGRPALMLDVGAAAREAVYAGRSADDTLRFTYTVGPHDAAPDGLGIGARALSLHGGAITTSNNGLDAQIGNQALPPQAGHRVDSATAAASEVALTGIAILSDPGADGLYSLGETITLRLSYSGALRFPEGATPALVLDIGGVERRAAFQGLNGLAALTFAYPTAFGDHDADGLSVVENGLTLPPLAKLRDDFGRTVAHAHAGQAFPAHPVQSGRIVAVEIVSEPHNRVSYLPPETIEVELTFHRGAMQPDTVVVAGGTPSIGVEVGGAIRRARYVRGSGTSVLTFAYEVTAADGDGDGVSVPANGLALDGATIIDGRGAAMPLVHPGVDRQPAHLVGRPVVAEAAVVSEPGSNGVYTLGEFVDVEVRFSEPVTMTGPGASLGLDVGGASRVAALHAIGARSVTFRYAVAAEDVDVDGLGLVHNALTLEAGTTISGAGRNASVDLAAQTFPAHRVHGDGTGLAVAFASVPSDGVSYLVGETIEVTATFAAAVEVIGTPSIGIKIGSVVMNGRPVLSSAAYTRGSGTEQLTFAYEVTAGSPRNSDGAGVPASSLALGEGGAIVLAAGGAPAFLEHAAIARHPSQAVGGAASVQFILILGLPGNAAPGAEITLYVQFDARMTLTGTLSIDLAVGSKTRTVSVESHGLGPVIVFKYEVAEDDRDTDGVSVVANSLRLAPGATLRSGGRDAVLDHGAQTFPGYVVNAAAVAVSIASAPANGVNYLAGESIRLDADFGSAVDVEGAPFIDVGVGGAVRQAGYAAGSGTAVLTFAYPVVREDSDHDGVSVPADGLALGDGGSIAFADGSGEQPLLTLAALGAQSAHRVGAPYVTAIEMESDPGEDGIYTAGEPIEVKFVFSEPTTSSSEVLAGGVRRSRSWWGTRSAWPRCPVRVPFN